MLKQIETVLPLRFWVLALCAALTVLAFFSWAIWGTGGLVFGVAGLLTLRGVLDLRQSHHAITRNYPVIGHLRFLLEFIRPEIRQYFMESDREAAPFSRAQRSLVYQRAKGQTDARPFGTQLDVGERGYEWINHSVQPTALASSDFRLWVGGEPGQPSASAWPCTQPYEASVFNISAMSFGSLSANAIRSLNKGAALGGFAHDTGEGSISRHHREHGGDLIWEIGSGYFGCRHEDGSFSEEKFVANACDPQVKMIELKISQGAKPGHGGVLPGAKVTPEIAEARGVPVGVTCVSPAAHSAFSTPLEMMAFIARLRQLSGGKPTGFKLAIGHAWEWFAMVRAMQDSGITPDFIVVDGAEGGTGAAPVEFSDHVGMPLQEALQLVHHTLVGVNLRNRIRIGAAGKMTSAFDMARLMALGADWCNAARGYMMALGCIQAQTCHTGECPTGVTTQDPLRQRALVVSDKAIRVKNFHHSTLHALQELVQAAGLQHPREITAEHIMRRVSATEVQPLSRLITQMAPGALLGSGGLEGLWRDYWPQSSAQSFALQPVKPAPRRRRSVKTPAVAQESLL